MAAATTVKVNNAIEPTIAHLRKLVDARRRTAVRDRVLDESVWAFSQGAADVGLGLVLLIDSRRDGIGSSSVSASWRSSPRTSAGSASCREWSGACWRAASRSLSRSIA